MSLVCLYVCKSVCTWVKHGDGGQEKGGFTSHEGLREGIVGRGAGPSFQSVRLAPHLPGPSVHLPIAHKPTPSSTTDLTIDYTVLAHWLARWSHNSLFYIKKSRDYTWKWNSSQMAGSSVIGSHLSSCCAKSVQHRQNYGVIFGHWKQGLAQQNKQVSNIPFVTSPSKFPKQRWDRF